MEPFSFAVHLSGRQAWRAGALLSWIARGKRAEVSGINAAEVSIIKVAEVSGIEGA